MASNPQFFCQFSSSASFYSVYFVYLFLLFFVLLLSLLLLLLLLLLPLQCINGYIRVKCGLETKKEATVCCKKFLIRPPYFAASVLRPKRKGSSQKLFTTQNRVLSLEIKLQFSSSASFYSVYFVYLFLLFFVLLLSLLLLLLLLLLPLQCINGYIRVKLG